MVNPKASQTVPAHRRRRGDVLGPAETAAAARTADSSTGESGDVGACPQGIHGAAADSGNRHRTPRNTSRLLRRPLLKPARLQGKKHGQDAFLEIIWASGVYDIAGLEMHQPLGAGERPVGRALGCCLNLYSAPIAGVRKACMYPAAPRPVGAQYPRRRDARSTYRQAHHIDALKRWALPTRFRCRPAAR